MAYVLLLAILALGVPSAVNLSARVNAEVRTQAQAQADLVGATAGDLLDPSHRLALDTLARSAARSVRARILIVDARGAVLADSAGPAQVGASYESRPEIDAALAGRQVQVQRASTTLGQEILATAVPIIHDGRPIGAVRVTQSVSAVHGAINRAELQLGLLALIVLALGLSAGVVIAGQVARPLARLERVARRVATGDLRARAELEGSREQRSLAASFNEMTDRIARLLNAQRDFVADASHQLRTPLTGLRLRLEEAAADRNGHGPDVALSAAIGEVDRLAQTVEELLILSRGGVRQMAGTLVDLGELADSAVERWRSAAAERGITIVRVREGEGSSAWIGRPDLERALDALIENGLRYARPGTRVTIITSAHGIAVLDRGPGLAADELDHVFERFHRGAAGRSGPPGSGLGLPIARELARAWGAEVTIANRDGGGAIATLSLPVAAASAASGEFAIT